MKAVLLCMLSTTTGGLIAATLDSMPDQETIRQATAAIVFAIIVGIAGLPLLTRAL